LVIQIGLPSTREQYIHRLGRTARAGKSGEGLLLLAPHEVGRCRLTLSTPLLRLQARNKTSFALGL